MACIICGYDDGHDVIFCDSCLFRLEDKYQKLITSNFTEDEYNMILICMTNPFNENPYWDLALNRYPYRKESIKEDIDKYIKLIKDNFREDEYSAIQNYEVKWKKAV